MPSPTMGVAFKQEFKLQNFGLKHHQPLMFVKSQWDIHHYIYIAWRCFWPLWHTGWSTTSMLMEGSITTGEEPNWLIYLTNISYLLLNIQSILNAAVVIHPNCTGKTEEHFEGETSKWHHSILWVLTTICFNSSIIVSFLYWALVFKELKYPTSVMTHAINSLYVLTDIFVSAIPVRLLHFIYTMLYAAFYILFTIIYHLLDAPNRPGTNSDNQPYVYNALDWSNTAQTVGTSFGVMFGAVPLVHFFQFALYTLSIYMYETCSCCLCCGCGKGTEDGGDGGGMSGKISPEDVEMKAVP